jgi:hypothetical protein
MTDITNTNVKIMKDMYLDMYGRYEGYKQQNRVEPKIIYTVKGGADFVTLARFKEMQKRFDAWWTANGTQPNFVYVVNPETSTKTSYVQAFENAVGMTINNFTQGYNAIKYRVYAYYYNDIYNQATALQRLKDKSGLNCSDICQLMYQLAKDLGYSVRYVNIKCQSGAGHIQLDIAGGEFTPGWHRIDPAAALKSGYEIGEIWCENHTLIGYDQAWLLSDDGKT